MQRLFMSLALGSFLVLGVPAQSLAGGLSDMTTPTEVGTTSIPSGDYVVTDNTTGKSYGLTVTTKGTMILSPAGASSFKDLNNLPEPTSFKEKVQQQVQQGVNDLVKTQGQQQIQKLIK